MHKILFAFMVVLGLLSACGDSGELEIIDAAPNTALVRDDLPLRDLAVDRIALPTGWRRAERISFEATSNTLVGRDSGLTLFIESKTNELVQLLPDHGDLVLDLEFMQTTGAAFSLYLQGRYRLDFGPAADEGSACGLVYSGAGAAAEVAENYRPYTDACRAAGVWQHLRLYFQAPEASDGSAGPGPAVLKSAYLNDNLIHYQRLLHGPSPASPLAAGDSQTPLLVRAHSGAVALRNLRTLDRAGRSSSVSDAGTVELNLPTIRYRYYEMESMGDDFTAYDRQPPVATGYIDRFDLNGIRKKGQNFAIRFSSKIDIPRQGDYTFMVRTPSSARLYIDDQLVVDNGGRHGFTEVSGTIALSEGSHDLRLDYAQNQGWKRLDVAYQAPGGERRLLNSLDEEKTIATFSNDEPLPVETDAEPFLLRSFVYFPSPRVYEPARKRTHALSVGEDQGPHYTIDLQSGALLMAWQGAFVDAGQMWVDRGEPQVVKPLGGTVNFSGEPQWVDLSEPGAAWPDTISPDDDFQHLRYELDDQGRPLFFYTINGQTVSDRLVPEAGQRSLVRELLAQDGEGAYTLIAHGRRIEPLADNHYEVVGQGYTIELLEPRSARLYLRNEGESQRLIARMDSGGSLRYRIRW